MHDGALAQMKNENWRGRQYAFGWAGVHPGPNYKRAMRHNQKIQNFSTQQRTFTIFLG
jgi:hypothetical protein